MDSTKMEIHKFFDSIDKYAFGDLLLFQKLAHDAEKQEIIEDKSGEGETATTTSQTTQYHSGSFSSTSPEPICRATIPFTLMIFSCMDILGYLVKEEGWHGATDKNFISFFKYVDLSPSEDEINCLTSVFRHPMAHNYFPKLSQSISYHSQNPDRLFFTNGRDTRIILNVNKLQTYFIEGYGQIKMTESLYEKMNKRFTELTKHYEENEKCKLLN